MQNRFDVRFLFHNIVVHPVCGWCWLFGIATEWADRIHDATGPNP